MKWGLIILLGCIVSIPFFFMLKKRKKRIDVFSPYIAFPMFYFFLYGIGSLRWIYEDYPNVYKSLIYAIIGMISYFAGAIFIEISWEKNKFKNKIKILWKKNRLIIINILYFALGILAIFIIYSKIGIPMLSVRVLDKESHLQGVSGYIIFLIRFIPIGALFIFTYLFTAGIKKSVLLQLALIILFSAVSLMAGSRNILFFFLMSLILIYHYAVRPFSLSRAFVILAVFMVSLFFVGFFRAIRSYEIPPSIMFIRNELQLENMFLIFVMHSALAFSSYARGFMDILNLIPNSMQFFYGKISLITLSTFLPGKQYTFGEILKSSLDLKYPGGGLNPTLLGELYGDFGILGIVFLMALYGLILNRSYKKIMEQRGPTNIIIYAFLYSSILLGTLTGLYSQAMFIFHGLVIFATIFFISKRIYQKHSE
jgi:oligosaccharide repeat unit polymerase